MNEVSDGVITNICKLYKANENAEKLFDWIAGRQRDATATTIDRISSKLGISRAEIVTLARNLEEAGCGTFVVGRRGQKSRFVWTYSCISLGQAAAGEDVRIEQVVDPVSETEEEADDVVDASVRKADDVANKGNLPHLTISQAKAALAVSLGVPITAIEIVVRS